MAHLKIVGQPERKALDKSSRLAKEKEYKSVCIERRQRRVLPLSLNGIMILLSICTIIFAVMVYLERSQCASHLQHLRKIKDEQLEEEITQARRMISAHLEFLNFLTSDSSDKSEVERVVDLTGLSELTIGEILKGDFVLKEVS